MCMYVCTYVCVYVCMCMYVYTVYVCVYVYMYVCMYVCKKKNYDYWASAQKNVWNRTIARYLIYKIWTVYGSFKACKLHITVRAQFLNISFQSVSPCSIDWTIHAIKNSTRNVPECLLELKLEGDGRELREEFDIPDRLDLSFLFLWKKGNIMSTKNKTQKVDFEGTYFKFRDINSKFILLLLLLSACFALWQLGQQQMTSIPDDSELSL